MPEFIEIPELIPLGRDWWLMDGREIVRWGEDDVDIIEGPMITDGPSIPVWARAVVPWRSILLSGLWHDDKRGKKGMDGKPARSNFAVDGEFFDLIKHEMTYRHRYPAFKAWWTALICYIAVRLGTYTNFSADPPEWVRRRAQQVINQRNI
ncbi:hypothetical protein [Cerasicoccus frondis]|uniref:hypothetical protein n=1 Tax=Cerasicoccus frondis TaxID=490090 RepID=UPI002852C266|nr:hypothetical protein [Cerasicoccus frondis]